MKLTAQRADLAPALARAARGLTSRLPNPALASLRLKATDDGLTVESFDYESAHRVEVDAKVEATGEIAVGVMLAALTKAAPAEDIELKEVDGHLSVKAGRSTYRLQAFNRDELPDLPGMPAPVGNVPLGALEVALKAVGWVPDPGHLGSSEALHGLGLVAEDRTLSVVGLTRNFGGYLQIPYMGPAFSAHVPSPALAASVRDSGDSGEVGFHTTGDLLTVTTLRTASALRLYASEFMPKWRELFGMKKSGRFEVGADDMRAALQRLAIVGPQGAVDVTLDGAGVLMSLAFDGDAQEWCTAAAEGDAPAFRVNGEYLSKILAALSGRDVVVEHAAGRQSLYIHPVDAAGPLFVLMPIAKD